MKKYIFLFSFILFCSVFLSNKAMAQSPADPGDDPYNASASSKSVTIFAPVAPDPFFIKKNKKETGIYNGVFSKSTLYFMSQKTYEKSLWNKSLRDYLESRYKKALIISSKFRRLPLHQSLMAFSS